MPGNRQQEGSESEAKCAGGAALFTAIPGNIGKSEAKCEGGAARLAASLAGSFDSCLPRM